MNITDGNGHGDLGNLRHVSPDVILIGAGINASAILLAQAGWRVLVVERNDEPGGAVWTMGLTLPGFHHELGAVNLDPFISFGFYSKFKTALASKGVEFISARNSSGLLRSSVEFLSLTTDRNVNLSNIAAYSAADAKAWDSWAGYFSKSALLTCFVPWAPIPVPARRSEKFFIQPAIFQNLSAFCRMNFYSTR